VTDGRGLRSATWQEHYRQGRQSSEGGVDRYVGLEHLGSESLTISRWGLPTDVAATKLLFRRGDIILGRRRVYQRKLAVADFDGICSAHALVLRARSEAVTRTSCRTSCRPTRSWTGRSRSQSDPFRRQSTGPRSRGRSSPCRRLPLNAASRARSRLSTAPLMRLLAQ